jgi:hypothetical protein
MHVSGGSEVKHLDGLESRGSFSGLPSGAPEPRQAVCAGAAGSFSDAEIGGEQRSSKLIAELAVATW